MNPLGILLVAAGIVLLALNTLTSSIDTHWLGLALIVFGGVVIVWDEIKKLH